ncbi:hypothetical protein [Pseudomonas putida]|uniref:Uncharacterized protein n=1 Tax=Pseudomonas putida TaxID=303 RepID=A0A8I1JH98_PSEPU|nr:hypothetical protein [Pseudomonas putida]MBI6882456.1 hypothetical protein [Pseudomonas putida]
MSKFLHIPLGNEIPPKILDRINIGLISELQQNHIQLMLLDQRHCDLLFLEAAIGENLVDPYEEARQRGSFADIPRPWVNVGTIGHFDPSLNILTKAMNRARGVGDEAHKACFRCN